MNSEKQDPSFPLRNLGLFFETDRAIIQSGMQAFLIHFSP
jgi:hypothetical protein